MKKIIPLLTLISLLVLSACGGASQGGGEQAGSVTQSGSGSKEQVTLRYGIWDVNQKPAMEEIGKMFSEKHPNVKVSVEVSPYDQYMTKLESGAASGNAPDVFWLNPLEFLKYSANGMLIPLNDKINADKVINLDNYPKALVDIYTYDNKNYGIPINVDGVGLWYNKQLFDAAGVKYPDDTWDWGTVLDAAKKLTDPSKGVWGIAADMNPREGFYNTIYQAGGIIISPDRKKSGYDSAAAIEGIRFWTDLIHKHKVSPTLAQMTDTPANSLFQSGKVAMYMGGSWKGIEFAKNENTKNTVNVAVLPKGKERATTISGLSNVIYAKTKHPNEAWEFVKFAGSKEAAEQLAKTGIVIPAYKGTADAWVKSTPNFNLQVFVDMLAYGKENPYSFYTGKWKTVEKETFQKAWMGELTPEEAGKEAAVKMNELLAQEKK